MCSDIYLYIYNIKSKTETFKLMFSETTQPIILTFLMRVHHREGVMLGLLDSQQIYRYIWVVIIMPRNFQVLLGIRNGHF